MKPTTIAKSALALALGMVACAASASLTENFESFNLGTTIAGTTNNSLGWASSGTADLSYVTNDIMGAVENKALKVATEGDTLSATIQGEEATSLNAALAGGKAVTFTCNANLEPTDDLESISGSDLKFALYAYAHDNTTNLVVYALDEGTQAGSNYVTTTAITSSNTAIEVTITNTVASGDPSYQFTVKVGGTPVPGTFKTVNTSAISKLDISGNGAIDNIGFAYAAAEPAYNAGDPLPGTTTHTLTANEATYLNNVLGSGTQAALETILNGMTEEQFEDAFALNTDIIKDSGAPQYSFNITSITPSGDNVVVEVTLTRANGLGAINGTLHFYTSADGVSWGDGTSIIVPAEKFGTGTTATISVPKSENDNFFKATIE